MANACVTAWNNTAWVLAAMHYPHEPEILNFMAGPPSTTLWRVAEEGRRMTAAARQGIVAGHVLSVLYALATSPWRIPEPSFAKAIYCVEQYGFGENYRDGIAMPRGKTEIRACYDAMRPVAHLWAATRLHREYPMLPHDDLMRSERGIRALLQIARSVQYFALTWRPPRRPKREPLLSEHPLLVPDEVVPLKPPWTHAPDWLLKTVPKYRNKSTRKKSA